MNAGITVLTGNGARGVNVAMPDGVAYTGAYVTRFQVYGGELYAEYEFRSSGTLSVASGMVWDFYLVGQGGTGGLTGHYTPEGQDTIITPGGGGGSGYPVTAQGVAVDASAVISIGGATTVAVGAQTWTAAAGGNGGNAHDNQSPHGTGFQGTYYLFDDEAWPVGTAQYTANSFYGSNGCSVLSLVRGGTSGATRSWPYGGVGYGAGGAGGRDLQLTDQYGWDERGAPTTGAQGVVIARVALGRAGGSGVSGAIGAMDISAVSGEMSFYSAAGYAGPVPYLDEQGQLVIDGV